MAKTHIFNQNKTVVITRITLLCIILMLLLVSLYATVLAAPDNRQTDSPGFVSQEETRTNDSSAGAAVKSSGATVTQPQEQSQAAPKNGVKASPPATTEQRVAPKVASSSYINGLNLYVDTSLTGRPAEIADRATARWFGEWSGDPRAASNAYVSAASAVGQVATVVLYNIPSRDCGSYSAGGAGSALAYRSWIDGIAAGIGGRRAIIILEPDALPQADCLSSGLKQERYASLLYAVQKLKGTTGANVYIDAGHAAWKPITYITAALNQVGINQADGFALNVSNFQTTAATISYGDQIVAQVGKGYVIDTSRNGRGSNGEWCNPSGRGLGKLPTTSTGLKNVHAYLWVKIPGESDGTCNGAPAAGQYWADGANELIRYAVY